VIDLSFGNDAVARIHFDTPGEKVNLLTEESLIRLRDILERIEAGCARGEVRGVILTSGKKGIFLAGADVKAFVAVARAGDALLAARKAREGQALFSRLAALPAPTVAAINGACLGGGLELALACTSRLAADGEEVSVGLPEVRLGLIPGWGGTYRLPRLLGAARALDLILTGRTLGARQALKLGLVDAVVPLEGLETAARAEALRLASSRKRRASRGRGAPFLDAIPPARALVFALARRKILRQTRGHYPAPLAALEAVRYGIGRNLEDGLAREAELLSNLIIGEVSKNLVHIFLSSRSSGASSTDGASQSCAPIARIGVLGAGTMGGGITAVAALAGFPVRLRDVSAEALERGMKQVRALAEERARKGRLARHEAARREALVAPTVDSTGFSRCDLVIEAVVEDLELKRQVLREMESLTAPSAIFATNTSSLSVTGIAAASSRPGRVLGLHFFNPVEKMPLVEVVRGPATEESAVQAAVQFARKLGKTPVVVKDTPGFIVNRILGPYLAEALRLLAARHDITALDEAMVRFGMPMGPFALLDQIGLDVAAKVSDVLTAAFPDRGGDPRLLHAMMQAGLLGVKAGNGFYFYRDGKIARQAPELARVLAAVHPGRASVHRQPSAAGAAETLVDAMVNEAALLLGEEAVDRPDVIDLAMVMGTGFPPFRGGLLRYADSVGKDVIAGRIRARGMAPAPLLERKGRFYP